MTNSTKQKDISFYSKTIVGPVMLSYVEWIISEAESKGLKRLYFLARDGYLLYEIAKRICSFRKIGIECRYLYCSRQSLRMPSYHIIGDEAFDILLLGGYYVTPKSIFERAMLSENEINEICAKLNIDDANRAFTYKELEKFRKDVKNCEFYKSIVIEHSQTAYRTTIEYLKQEGLFENDNLAIVDSGWTGSMQRTLRQLLTNEGFKGSITGFYFGMYAPPKEELDGDYLTFYFDANSGAKRKAAFNNNLFECMLSANHPMTIGYECSENGFIIPVFAPPTPISQLKMIEAQIKGALEFVEQSLLNGSKAFSYKKASQQTYKLIKKFMLRPSKNFATVYGAFAFCDDVTEGYYMTLADPSKRKLLKKYMLIPRIFRKIFKIRKADEGELFWPYGVIAFCPAIIRPWYRINVRAWEFLKALLK